MAVEQEQEQQQQQEEEDHESGNQTKTTAASTRTTQAPAWLALDSLEQGEVDPVEHAWRLRRRGSLDEASEVLQRRAEELLKELADEANGRYADLANLGSDVVDIPSAAARARGPLKAAKRRLEKAREVAAEDLQRLEECMQAREDAHRARRALEMQQGAMNAAGKLERLVSRINEGDLSDAAPQRHSPSRNGHKSRDLASKCKHLARAASEAQRLALYTSSGSDLKLVVSAKERCEPSLEKLASEVEKSLRFALQWHDQKALEQALSACASLNERNRAERAIREEVTAPAVSADAERASDSLSNFFSAACEGSAKQCAWIADALPGGEMDALGGGFLAAIIDEVEAKFPDSPSAGRPEEFLEAYRAAVKLMEAVESMCFSEQAVRAVRESDAFSRLFDRFDMAVFASLRFQELAAPLERALELGISSCESPGEFRLQQIDAAKRALEGCWDQGKLVPAMADRMLSLTFKVCGRVGAYVSEVDSDPSRMGDLAGDLLALSQWVHEQLPSIMKGLLAEEALTAAKEAVRRTADEELTGAARQALEKAASKLAAEGGEHLKHMSGISATYRMANKAPPSKASHFVQRMVQPVREFLERGSSSRLPEWARDKVAKDAAEFVTEKYADAARELMATVRRTESSLARLKKGNQQQQQEEGGSGEMSYMDKVLEQLRLDVQEHSRHVSALGVDPSSLPSIASLNNACQRT